jgi:hypothetical protein
MLLESSYLSRYTIHARLRSSSAKDHATLRFTDRQDLLPVGSFIHGQLVLQTCSRLEKIA